MEEYLIPTPPAQAELVEKKSRFIGHIWPVESEEQALALLQSARKEHYNATHNVYAYILKDGAMRYSDDGEPQGTAGMPVLDVLRKEQVFNALCVVTRYFGGTLLGAGGLVRAYGKACKLALDAAGVSQKRVWDQVEIPCPYAMLERLKLEVTAHEGQVIDTEYGADVLLHCRFPHVNTEALVARVVDVSNGRIRPVVVMQEYRAFPVEK